MKAPFPRNEAERLAALRECAILDTHPEEIFDDIPRLASYICQTPIAIISLVDASRQWFKAKVGLDAGETPRDVGFCAHAILKPDLFIVKDTLLDERFTTNPYVVSDPHIRFYAGAPLITSDGYALGTLCIIDRVPRELSDEQMEALRVLARHTVTQLELRRNSKALAELNHKLDREIAERRRAENEREELLVRAQQARLEAEAASRAKDTFLATVSHELRTPLTSMMGWAELLKLGMLDEKGQVHAIDVIESSARAQAQLIGDLLDISRIISGKLRLEVQPVELPPVIEAAMDVVHPAAEAKAIQLVMRFEQNVGMVSGDPDRLQQVVWNLLSNAVKFTPEGGRVEIALRRTGTQAELVVTDSGRGISPDFLPHVFERFRQADSAGTRSPGGLGLGLSIVRHLVELHGGRIRAESDGDGRGATFRVTLPLLRRTRGKSSAPTGSTPRRRKTDEPATPLVHA